MRSARHIARNRGLWLLSPALVALSWFAPEALADQTPQSASIRRLERTTAAAAAAPGASWDLVAGRHTLRGEVDDRAAVNEVDESHNDVEVVVSGSPPTPALISTATLTIPPTAASTPTPTSFPLPAFTPSIVPSSTPTSGIVVSGRAYPRGDVDCSLTFTAADAVAQIRTLGGDSACGNDDCDRDGDTDADDVACTAGCLFGPCPVPPNAPRVGGIAAGSAPAIVPFSAVRLMGVNFGDGKKPQTVYIGGRRGEVVGEQDGETVVIVPNLPPGTHDLIFTDGDLAGAPFPVTVEEAQPIGRSDSFTDVTGLILDAVNALLAPELDEVYGESATVLRRELEAFRDQFPTRVADLTADPVFAQSLQSRLDAWLEGSGAAECLRDDIATLATALESTRAAGQKATAVAADVTAVVPAVTKIARGVAEAGRTILATGSEVVAAGAAEEGAAGLTIMTIGGDVVVVAAGVAEVAAAVLVLTEDTPIIDGIEPAIVAPGEPITLRGMGFGGFVEPNLVIRTPTGAEIPVTTSEAASEDSIQFRIPDAVGVCGTVDVYLTLPLLGINSPSALPVRIRPVVDPLEPDTLTGGEKVRLGVHGVAGCNYNVSDLSRADATIRQTEGAKTAFGSSVDPVNGEVNLVETHIRNAVPGRYELLLRLDELESDPQPFILNTDLNGMEIECQRTTLKTGERIQCTTFPSPYRFPAGETLLDYTASPEDIADIEAKQINKSIGSLYVDVDFIGKHPGTVSIDATLHRTDIDPPRLIVEQKNLVTLTVVDETEPTIEVAIDVPDGGDPKAVTPVEPGGTIQITVTGNDDAEMALLRVLASGSAISDGAADPPRVQEFECPRVPGTELHSRTCTHEFVFQVRASGFASNEISLLVQAFDASDNAASPVEVRFRVNIRTGRITGAVRDAETRLPVADATVELFDDGDELVAEQTSDDGGGFVFEGVPVGMYSVTASRSDFEPATENAVVEADAIADIEVLLQPLAVVPTPTPGSSTASLRRIADTSTALPGGRGVITSFGEFAIDAGQVAFQALSGSFGGLYLASNLDSEVALDVVVDEDTLVPMSHSVTFPDVIIEVSIDGDYIAFAGGNEIWFKDTTVSSPNLTDGVDTIDLVALGFANAEVEELRNTTSVFSTTFVGRAAFGAKLSRFGTIDQPVEAIYVATVDSAQRIADVLTPIPGGAGTFTEFPTARGIGAVAFDGTNLAFLGHGSDGQQGVYLSRQLKALNVVANTTTPIDGASFTTFYGVSIDADRVVFKAMGPTQEGIYSYSLASGVTTKIADRSTPLPPTGEEFLSFFNQTAVEGNTVVFRARRVRTPRRDAIFASVGGNIEKIVEVGDTLDGKTVQSIFLSDRRSVDANRVAFAVHFDDASQALYVARLGQ